MTLLPKWFTGVLKGFAPLFSARIWPQVQLLVVGALLSPGKRTVTAVLRVLGLADDPRFGPFCTGPAKVGCQRVRQEQLAQLHLTYLRRAFREKGEAYQQLMRFAHIHRFSRNRIGLFGLDAAVTANV